MLNMLKLSGGATPFSEISNTCISSVIANGFSLEWKEV